MPSHSSSFLLHFRIPKKRQRTEPPIDIFQNLLGIPSFEDFDPEDCWCYFAYKHMAFLRGKSVKSETNPENDEEEAVRVQKQEEVLNAIRWDDFGFPGRDGKKSTLWIGTEGSLLHVENCI